MKKMKMTKRLALFALSFTLVCSLILGATSIVNNGVSASDDSTVQTVSLFSLTKGDTRSCAVLDQGTYREKKGIYAGPSYSKADWYDWNVDFAHTFSGDFEMEYSLPNIYNGVIGFIEFVFSDLDGNPVIKVGLEKWGHTATDYKYASVAYVYDVENGTYYSIKNNGTSINSKSNSDCFSTSKNDGNCYGFYPYATPANADETEKATLSTGKIALSWSGNAVDVKLTRQDNPGTEGSTVSLQTVATITSATELKDGYKVSVGRCKTTTQMWGNNVNATTGNVADQAALILSINNLSMGSDTVSLGTKKASGVVYTGTTDDNFIVIEKGENLSPFTATVKQNITGGWFIQTEETVQVEDYSNKTIGNYQLTVEKNNFNVKVVAAVSSVKGSDLFTLDSEKPEKTMLSYESVSDKSGVYVGISKNEANADYFGWTAQFKGSFSGDFELEYSLAYANWSQAFVEFVFADANDNPVIKIGIKKWGSTETDIKYASAAYVYDVENETYYSIKKDGTKINSKDNSDCFGKNKSTAGAYGFYPYSTGTLQNSLSSGKIVLSWNDDDTVDVKLTRQDNPGTEGSTVSLQTVATISASKLKDGYKVSFGRIGSDCTMWGNSQSNGVTCAGESVLILSVNGVSFANENVKTSVNVTSFEYNGTTNVGGSINVAKGENLSTFTGSGKQCIGGWNLGTDCTNTVSADAISDKNEGTYQVKVYFGKNYSKTFTVNVVDNYTTLVANAALTVREGAWIYADDNSNGIRFQMSIPVTDYTNLKNAGSTTYGMIIMPADYLITCGELTVDNLFGENAIYGWGDNTDGKVKVSCKTYNELAYNESVLSGNYYMNISIKNILDDNINRKFVAVGFVKCVINNVDYYRIATYKDSDINNSQRSMYEVAKAAYSDTESDLGTDQKATLKSKYIDVIDVENSQYSTYKIEYYKVENSTSTLVDSVLISAKVGTTVNIPMIGSNYYFKAYEGFACDSGNEDNVLSGAVVENGLLTLKVYYKAAN